MTKLHLNEIELAKRWGVSPKTLQRWRTENRGPAYLKLSKRVTYPIEDIIAFEASQKRVRENSHEFAAQRAGNPVSAEALKSSILGGSQPGMNAQSTSPFISDADAARATKLPRYYFTNATKRVEMKIPHYLVGRLVRFKLSRDKQFSEKLHDVVGLYLNPPDKALVLCVDEKSQIQALDRTRPTSPLRPGIPERQTHDYTRHGTTTLFAALSMLDGKVIGDCMPRHRHQEFIRFLQLINVKTPADLNLHLIVDNYGTHKHARVKSWLKRHPRFQLHFIPTSSSWLNMVERWFREITDKRIRRGSFKSVPDLISAIMKYLENHNQNPRIFIWSASVERILSKIAKCKEALDSLH